MKNTEQAGYHNLLYFAKWFVMIIAVLELVTGFGHAFSQARIIDQCYAALKTVLLFSSIRHHDRKTGLWLFAAYMIIELSYFYLIVLLSGNVNGMFNEQLMSYTAGTTVILIPTLLYYRNRQELLK